MECVSNSNIVCKGMLYGKMGNHLSKGISCCPNGDAKFIKAFNEIAKSNPRNLKISFLEDNTKKILVETSEAPKMSIFENLFYLVSNIQKKALNMKKKGVISSFIYKISELEYQNIKNDYFFIRKKTLKEFENNIRNLVSEDNKKFLDEFFN